MRDSAVHEQGMPHSSVGQFTRDMLCELEGLPGT